MLCSVWRVEGREKHFVAVMAAGVNSQSDEAAVVRYLRTTAPFLDGVPDHAFQGIDGTVLLGMDADTIDICFPDLGQRERGLLLARVKTLRREEAGGLMSGYVTPMSSVRDGQSVTARSQRSQDRAPSAPSLRSGEDRPRYYQGPRSGTQSVRSSRSSRGSEVRSKSSRGSASASVLSIAEQVQSHQRARTPPASSRSSRSSKGGGIPGYKEVPDGRGEEEIRFCQNCFMQYDSDWRQEWIRRQDHHGTEAGVSCAACRKSLGGFPRNRQAQPRQNEGAVKPLSRAGSVKNMKTSHSASGWQKLDADGISLGGSSSGRSSYARSRSEAPDERRGDLTSSLSALGTPYVDSMIRPDVVDWRSSQSQPRQTQSRSGAVTPSGRSELQSEADSPPDRDKMKRFSDWKHPTKKRVHQPRGTIIGVHGTWKDLPEGQVPVGEISGTVCRKKMCDVSAHNNTTVKPNGMIDPLKPNGEPETPRMFDTQGRVVSSHKPALHDPSPPACDPIGHGIRCMVVEQMYGHIVGQAHLPGSRELLQRAQRAQATGDTVPCKLQLVNKSGPTGSSVTLEVSVVDSTCIRRKAPEETVRPSKKKVDSDAQHPTLGNFGVWDYEHVNHSWLANEDMSGGQDFGNELLQLKQNSASVSRAGTRTPSSKAESQSTERRGMCLQLRIRGAVVVGPFAGRPLSLQVRLDDGLGENHCRLAYITRSCNPKWTTVRGHRGGGDAAGDVSVAEYVWEENLDLPLLNEWATNFSPGCPKTRAEVLPDDEMIQVRATMLRKILVHGDDARLRGSQAKKSQNTGGYPGLPQLMRWSSTQDWKSFEHRSYFEWCLPVPYPSTMHRDHYVANEAVAQRLLKDAQYMQCYRQALSFICLSWGFEVSPWRGDHAVREVLRPDRMQGWRAENSWRLRHALLSTELFGITELRSRLVEVASILSKRGCLHLEEDGFGEAVFNFGIKQAEAWWPQFVQKLGAQPPALREVLVDAAKAAGLAELQKEHAFGF